MLDWDELEAKTYGALRDVLGSEHKNFLNGGEDMKALASRVVEYWRRSSTGEILGGNVLDAAEHQGRALAVYYNIPTKGAPVRIGRRIRDFVLMGEAFLSCLGDEPATKRRSKKEDD